MADDVETLAALLDGAIDASEAPAELAQLASLATAVRSHATVPLPTNAFREGLREQLVQTTVAPAGGAAGGALGGGLGTQLPSVIAAVAATAVLASSGVALLAPDAVPGDLLYGAKRAIESAQLLVADDTRDAALLLDFATARVEEARLLTDVSAITDLLDESQAHIDQALALLADFDPAAAAVLLDDFTESHAAALFHLLEDVPDHTVATAAQAQLAATMRLGAGVVPEPAGPAGPLPSDEPTSGGEGEDDPDGDGDPAPTTAPSAPDDTVVPTEPAVEPTAPVETPTTPVDPVPTDEPTLPIDPTLPVDPTAPAIDTGAVEDTLDLDG